MDGYRIRIRFLKARIQIGEKTRKNIWPNMQQLFITEVSNSRVLENANVQFFYYGGEPNMNL